MTIAKGWCDMLFNSFTFLAFFTVVVVVYYVIPYRFRWPLLLAASLYFYYTFHVGYVALLLGNILAVYLIALAMDRAQEPGQRKMWLTIGVVVSLAPLIIYKYFNFFAGSIDGVLMFMRPVEMEPLLPRLEWLLPAGLSFYTFSCVSYLVDVFRNKLPVESHLGRFALYIAFFPKLLAGPIERATTFLPQVLNPTRITPAQVTVGLQLILWGLFKKVVIADRLAAFVDVAYDMPAFASPVALIIATYFYAFQIYCDFSGYSDIAIGTARVLGINLMENFRRPYFSRSVPEFWGQNRWHISLNTWFRDYLYIPLGGSRVSRPRFYLNILAVFMVSGLWHGAAWTFVAWGALNGLFHLLTMAASGLKERVAKNLHLPTPLGTFLSILATFHLILVTWVFFRATSFSNAFTVFSRVAESFTSLPGLFRNYAYTGEFYLALALIVVLLLVEALDEWREFWARFPSRPVYVRWAFYYALIFCLVVIGLWGQQQFVYMQF
jgi:alginate O-acetyltransferase complex protein AlgI